MTDGPYVRVYLSILTDQKFVGIYPDDEAFAWWVRLLIVADQAYPAPASLPRGVSDGVVATLVGADVLVRLPNDLFTIKGLAAEREGRSKTARNAANQRWHPDDPPLPMPPDAPALPPHKPPDAPARFGNASQAEPSRNQAESETKPSTSRAPGDDVWDVSTMIEQITNRPFSYSAGSPVIEKLRYDVRDYGIERVRTAILECHAAAGRPVDGPWLINEAHKRLMPLTNASDAKAAADARKATEREQASNDRIARQRAESAEIREAMEAAGARRTAEVAAERAAKRATQGDPPLTN